MKKLWRNRPILIALLASALFLVLAALTVGRRTASRAEDMFSGAVLPVQEAVSDITDRSPISSLVFSSPTASSRKTNG